MASKKTVKGKINSDDGSEHLNQDQFLKDSPKPKKAQKRAKNEPIISPLEEEDMVGLLKLFEASAKKKKAEPSYDTNKVSRQRILQLVDHQQDAWKHCSENLVKDLEEITAQAEADYIMLKDNLPKLEHLTGTYMKCIQQATAASKLKVKSLRETCAEFKKKSEELESDVQAETEKVVDDLESDIKKLQDKLVAETKRSGWESVRRSIFHAMQNDI